MIKVCIKEHTCSNNVTRHTQFTGLLLTNKPMLVCSKAISGFLTITKRYTTYDTKHLAKQPLSVELKNKYHITVPYLLLCPWLCSEDFLLLLFVIFVNFIYALNFLHAVG